MGMNRLMLALVAILMITVGVLASSGGAIFDGADTSSGTGTTTEDSGTILAAGSASYDGEPPPYVDAEIGDALGNQELVEMVAPTVVSIVTETLSYGWFLQPIPETGAGTGVIISPDGYIVTNNHVVEDAQKITVTLSDGRTFEPTSVDTDPQTDLAVLKIDASDLPYLHFLGSSLEQLNELDEVVAVGNALALSGGPTWTSGVVSNLGRSIDLGNGVVLYDLIQTDAAINPGNSGGPLINMAGQLVGINVAIATDAENIGFAISTDTAIRVVDGLIAEGEIVRPWLGVIVATVTPVIQSQYELSVDEGALIIEVVVGSPADKAGLEANDVITSVAGETVSTADGLRAVVQACQPGDEVEITYFRGDEEKTTWATLAEATASS